MSGGPGEAGPAIGAEFAGHRIDAVLGTGGMGIVYRARNLALDQVRALKVVTPSLSADERFRGRFRRESRLAASIEHPNVIPVHQAGEEDGHLYLSMRLVEGRDLRDLIVTGGPLEPGLAAEVIRAVAGGLDAAHAAGLIHRDVKPANVLVGEGSDAGRVYLTDFGISRTMRGGETLTGTGELVGTADFVAPEQIAGDPVDHRADVYALGAVLYFALTGRSPFPRDNELATLFAHANAPRPRPSEARADLPSGLDAVIAQAMAVDPDDRFDSAGQLALALSASIEGEEAELPPPPRQRATPATEDETHRLPRPGDRRRGRWAAGLGAAAVVSAVAIFLLTRDSGTLDAPPVTVSAAVEVGEAPIGLDVGPSRVWVAASEDDEVDGIDLISSELAFEVRVAAPKAVAVGHDSVWVVSKQTDSLYRLDPLEDTPPQRFQLPEGADPVDLATDEQWVWVAEAGAEELLRFDPDTNAASGTVGLGLEPRSVAVGEGSVWVTNIDDDSVSRIDPDEHRRIGIPTEVDALPNDVAVGEGGVWVTSNVKGTVTRIDPGEVPTAGEPIRVGALPRGIDAGLGYVWVALGGEDSVIRIDPRTGDVVGDAIAVGDDPSDVSVGENAVWVANEADSTVTRIEP